LAVLINVCYFADGAMLILLGARLHIDGAADGHVPNGGIFHYDRNGVANGAVLWIHGGVNDTCHGK